MIKNKPKKSHLIRIFCKLTQLSQGLIFICLDYL